MSEKRRPRLSIGLPLYNGERYLRESLDSLLAQTFGDFELIISDNASTDTSGEICRDYAARDPRISYVRQARNRGGFWNHYHVIGLAHGEFFMWAAHDDIREPNYAERCIEILDERPEVVLCYSETRNIDDNGEDLDAREVLIRCDELRVADRFNELIRMDHRLEPIYGVVRMHALARTALRGNYADSDRVLLAELVLQGPFFRISEKLFRRRDHAERSIRKHISRHERVRWIHPDGVWHLTFPYFRQLAEYARAIHRARLPGLEAVACYGHLGRWIVRHFRLLLSDLIYAARKTAKWLLLGQWG